MLSHNLYAFRDKKSGVLSNYFVSPEPFEKIKKDVSLSLLNLSFKDSNSPFVVYSDDYELVVVCAVPDTILDIADREFVNCNELLIASRKAYEKTHDQTSPDSELD